FHAPSSSAYYTLSLHDALPISVVRTPRRAVRDDVEAGLLEARRERLEVALRVGHVRPRDVRRVPEVDLHRKRQPCLLQQRLRLRSEEPRLNSSHVSISYAVFCL